EQREAFPAARQALAEVRAIQKQLYGDKGWRAIDAGWELKTLIHRSRLSPAERNQLKKALAFNEEAAQLLRKGQFARALPLVRKAVDIRKKLLTENHPYYATSLNNLAMLYKALGEYRKALPLFERAHELRKKLLSEDHPHYALSLNNLALLYQ